ncbi:AraC family ligand binding domain-containing protein [Rhodococcus qingshengii]|uniref:AraC family ligand binding domain-containing protein n=1 Tax=Rhodococcus qingshengii TaxID=334542 RepID=UPI0036D85CA8
MSTIEYSTRPKSLLALPDSRGRTFKDFQVYTNVVDGVTAYGAHRHPEHQIAWMSEGTMQIAAGGNVWHLHSEHLVWLPGTVLHDMTLLTEGCMIAAYARPDLRPAGPRWTQPLVLEVDTLSAQLLRHLADRTIDDARRLMSQELLYDILAAAPERHDVLAVPRNAAASSVSAPHPCRSGRLTDAGGVGGRTRGQFQDLDACLCRRYRDYLRAVENSSTHVCVTRDARAG